MPFSPAGRAWRFTVLLLASLMTFGANFGYDSVGAIETTLIEAFRTDRAAVGAMYSAYSVAAVGAVLAAGALTDRIGVRRASLLFSTLTMCGAAAVAAAPTLPLLYAGRVVFGMGAESLMVVQSAVLARWFTGKELALSFGLMITFARLGTLFSFNTEALAAELYGFRGALWLAAAICAASLLCAWLYTVLDRSAETVLRLPAIGAGDRIAWSDLRAFPPAYWYAAAACVAFYSAVFPFTALSTDLFHEKWGLPQASGQGAGFLAGVFYNFTHMFSTAQGTTSIVIAASMLFAPFAGGMVDRIGRRATLMALGSLLLVPTHLAIGFTRVPPSLAMMALGAAFVLVPAVVWAAVPLLVEETRVGTAYGVMIGLQNLGLLVFPYANGALRDATHGYAASQAMFAALGAAGLIFSLLLLRADRRTGGRLERAR